MIDEAKTQQQTWSDWLPFPDPRKQGLLTAPFGPGCYELRRTSGELILFGMGSHVAQRLTSLLPKPLGCGTRNNSRKRDYILAHLNDIEYRTCTTISIEAARQLERQMISRKSNYIFST